MSLSSACSLISSKVPKFEVMHACVTQHVVGGAVEGAFANMASSRSIAP